MVTSLLNIVFADAGPGSIVEVVMEYGYDRCNRVTTLCLELGTQMEDGVA
jgi:hypothetical protein